MTRNPLSGLQFSSMEPSRSGKASVFSLTFDLLIHAWCGSEHFNLIGQFWRTKDWGSGQRIIHKNLLDIKKYESSTRELRENRVEGIKNYKLTDKGNWKNFILYLDVPWP